MENIEKQVREIEKQIEKLRKKKDTIIKDYKIKLLESYVGKIFYSVQFCGSHSFITEHKIKSYRGINILINDNGMEVPKYELDNYYFDDLNKAEQKQIENLKYIIKNNEESIEHCKKEIEQLESNNDRTN